MIVSYSATVYLLGGEGNEVPPNERRLLGSSVEVGLLADGGGVSADELGEGGAMEFATHGVLSGEPAVVDRTSLVRLAGDAFEDTTAEFGALPDGFDDIEQAGLAG